MSWGNKKKEHEEFIEDWLCQIGAELAALRHVLLRMVSMMEADRKEQQLKQDREDDRKLEEIERAKQAIRVEVKRWPKP